MRITKYFFILLFFTYFFTSSVVSLERDYDSCAAEEFYYCDSHQKASNRLSLIGEYLSLIPPSPSSQCYHVDCSKCHHAWCFESEIYYYDEDEDEDTLNIETHWTCDCGFDRNEDEFPSRWKKCRNFTIYPGYLSNDYVKYFSFFYDYLQYVNQNRSCNC